VRVALPLLQILDRLGDPQSIRSLTSSLDGIPDTTVRAAVRALVREGLVDRIGRDDSPELDKWTAWSPQATHFHFSTRDVWFRREATVMRSLDASHPPAPVKQYPGRPLIPLPAPDRSGVLSDTLLARRTWRRFGRAPLSLQDLSTLLGLTWGVQSWMVNPGHAPMALKTSPSGGARHSVEAYVIALRVSGLPRGAYHFNPDRHRLTRVGSHATPSLLRTLLPVQPWYQGASAVFVMTSVFERVRARYRHPRAYRGILLEAGHLCQTFCLVATSLGLAPFCTNAFADSAIERVIGVDGVGESAIYVAGVGTRPPGLAWGPNPARKPLPRLRAAGRAGAR